MSSVPRFFFLYLPVDIVPPVALVIPDAEPLHVPLSPYHASLRILTISRRVPLVLGTPSFREVRFLAESFLSLP